MIVEIVSFRHPPGASREALVEGARSVLPRWQANSDLIRKHFACSPDRSEGFGIYLWPSVAAARAAHDAQWIAEAEKRTGGPVHIRYLDLLMLFDNETGAVVEPSPSHDLDKA